jgi:hypothetical protein
MAIFYEVIPDNVRPLPPSPQSHLRSTFLPLRACDNADRHPSASHKHRSTNGSSRKKCSGSPPPRCPPRATSTSAPRAASILACKFRSPPHSPRIYGCRGLMSSTMVDSYPAVVWNLGSTTRRFGTWISPAAASRPSHICARMAGSRSCSMLSRARRGSFGCGAMVSWGGGRLSFLVHQGFPSRFLYWIHSIGPLVSPRLLRTSL